jgi:hypothetical protein
MAMSRTDAASWVLSVCIGCLRRSQAKTLAALVAGALGAGRLTLAGLGRQMEGPACVKHRIKRAWRFIANQRVEPIDVMRGVVSGLVKRHVKKLRGRSLLVSLDWTMVRSVHVLMAAVVIKGRAIPLCWGSYADKTLGKSQNALEEALLLAVRDMLGPQVKAIILADRGFGRTELGRFCQRHGFDYVIRIKSKVQVTIRGRGVRLDQRPVRRGHCRLYRNVLYRRHDPLTQHVVVRWKKGLPTRSDQPWYLMTNLDRPGDPRAAARHISDLYARRFDIEELFRDAKCGQFGYALSQTRITRPDRLDRLLLILVLAYLLLVGLGLWAKRNLPPRHWASNNRRDECSAFTVGRLLLDQRPTTRKRLLLHLLAALRRPGRNWG